MRLHFRLHSLATIGLLGIFAFSACTTVRERERSRGSSRARQAVMGSAGIPGPIDDDDWSDEEIRAILAAHAEDRKRAPRIQEKVNALFLKMTEVEPTGFAFDPMRLEKLKTRIEKNEDPDMIYFRENRPFFDQVPDEGGGFVIRVNSRRLQPIAETKRGKEALFREDARRLNAVLPRICFSSLEECTGDDSVAATEIRSDVERLLDTYTEKAFRPRLKKVLEAYRLQLVRYRNRPDWVQKGLAGSAISGAAVTGSSFSGPAAKGGPSQIKRVIGKELKWVKERRARL